MSYSLLFQNIWSHSQQMWCSNITICITMTLRRILIFDFSFLFSHCLKTCFERCNFKYKKTQGAWKPLNVLQCHYYWKTRIKVLERFFVKLTDLKLHRISINLIHQRNAMEWIFSYQNLKLSKASCHLSWDVEVIILNKTLVNHAFLARYILGFFSTRSLASTYYEMCVCNMQDTGLHVLIYWLTCRLSI